MQKRYKIATLAVCGLLLWMFAFDMILVEKEVACDTEIPNKQPPVNDCSDQNHSSSKCMIDTLIDNAKMILKKHPPNRGNTNNKYGKSAIIWAGTLKTAPN